MSRIRAPQLLLAALLCIAALLAGCNLPGDAPTPTRALNPDTPEGAVLAHAAANAPDPEAAANSFAPLHIWELDGDRLVAYSFAGGYGEAWSVCNGLARATSADGWQVVEAGARCWDADEASAITGLYSVVTDRAGNVETLIFGDVLSIDVTAVSVEFVVGGASAVATIGEGGYWLTASGAQPPARAVAIDVLGDLVQLLDFGAPLTMTPVGAPTP